MGATPDDEDHQARRRTIAVPGRLAAFLQRVMALPAGIHTVTLVKDANGADGVIGWEVKEGRLLEPFPKT